MNYSLPIFCSRYTTDNGVKPSLKENREAKGQWSKVQTGSKHKNYPFVSRVYILSRRGATEDSKRTWSKHKTTDVAICDETSTHRETIVW